MKNLVLVFGLISSFSFASANIESKELSIQTYDELELLYVCTVTTTTTIVDGYGETNEVSVTNTANTCFQAWKANQDEIKEMRLGLEGAQ